MSAKKVTMKELPRLSRPREKLSHYGPEKLSNSELLGILLRTGMTGVTAVELAERMLHRYSGKLLPGMKVSELRDCLGIGPAKACEIVACFELGRRLLKEKVAALCLSPEAVWQEMKDIRDNKKEHAVVFYLDAKHQEIKREIISVGILTSTLVHPREVFESAVRHSAAQIILSHNHPSGSLEPSNDDIRLTKRLASAGQILGITLLDHVIVTNTSYVSLRAHGLMPEPDAAFRLLDDE